MPHQRLKQFVPRNTVPSESLLSLISSQVRPVSPVSPDRLDFETIDLLNQIQ